jgi:hypothetical protein
VVTNICDQTQRTKPPGGRKVVAAARLDPRLCRPPPLHTLWPARELQHVTGLLSRTANAGRPPVTRPGLDCLGVGVTRARISHVLFSRLMWHHARAVSCALSPVYVKGGVE